MANIINSNSSSNIMDSLFPKIGESVAFNRPIWMENDRIFKLNEYVSNAGHRYVTGLRFSDQVAVIIKKSYWNSWTYLDSVEVYHFNEFNLEVIGTKKFDKQFYSNEAIHSAVADVIRDHIISSAKMNNSNIAIDERIVEQMTTQTERSFNNGEYPPITSKLRQLIEQRSKGAIEQ